jgi:hypothetical protein
MRSTILTLLALIPTWLLAPSALAGSPPILPVSGWLADTDGVGLEGDHDLTVALYDEPTSGDPLFLEMTTVSVDAGFFTAYAGQGAALDLLLFAEHDELWLGLSVDEGAEMTPRIQLGTAPWAAWAEFAGVADDALQLGGVDADAYLLASADSDTLGALACADGQIAGVDGASGWSCQAMPTFTETDPSFAASPASGISGSDLNDWNLARAWGDHATAGYLTGEADPSFASSLAAGIGSSDLNDWNQAHAWGDHAAAGYMHSSTATASFVARTGDVVSGSLTIVDPSQALHVQGPSQLVGDVALTGDAQINGSLTISDGRLNTQGRSWALSANIGVDPISLYGGGQLYGTDQCTEQTMPFPMEVDGLYYSRLCVCTNGYLHLKPSSAGSCTNTRVNEALPTDEFDHPTLFAYWGELTCEASQGDRVLYGYLGSAPNRVYIVRWECRMPSEGPPITFEAQLHQGSGLMNVAYHQVSPGTQGANATLGFQTAGGASARAYAVSYDAPLLDSGSSDQGFSVAPIR